VGRASEVARPMSPGAGAAVARPRRFRSPPASSGPGRDLGRPFGAGLRECGGTPKRKRPFARRVNGRKPLVCKEFRGAPEEIRTPDPQIRSSWRPKTRCLSAPRRPPVAPWLHWYRPRQEQGLFPTVLGSPLIAAGGHGGMRGEATGNLHVARGAAGVRRACALVRGRLNRGKSREKAWSRSSVRSCPCFCGSKTKPLYPGYNALKPSIQAKGAADTATWGPCVPLP
jgi:hypothetical protein